MKALTLTQPWASLVANEAKLIETRSWSTTWRGEILIHAAKNYPIWARNLAHQPEFRDGIGWGTDPEKLPRSVGLCVVEIIGCVRTEEMHKAEFILGHKPSVRELHYGDYGGGRYAWLLKYLRPWPDRTPMKGALGLWETDPQGRAEDALACGDTHL